jgi:hypothetical protein
VDIFCNSLSGAFLSLGDENFHFNQLQNWNTHKCLNCCTCNLVFQCVFLMTSLFNFCTIFSSTYFFSVSF